MTKREIVRTVLEHRRPPYVPWSSRFTVEARDKRIDHFGAAELEARLENHFVELGRDGGYVISPAHAVEGDVPLENMLAMIEEVQGQDGFR